MAEQWSTTFRNRLPHADWQDWAILVLAAWLFISPWVFPYGEANLPGMSPGEASEVSVYPAAAARILAVVLAVLAFSGLFRWLRVEKWLALIIGIFILLAPWAFGVTGGEHEIAVANEVVVGALVCVASLFKPTARGPIVQPI
jgi:hypothetical protein